MHKRSGLYFIVGRKDDFNERIKGENVCLLTNENFNQFEDRTKNTCVLEPRGLIRLLQFLFAIFAFATACSGGSSVSGSSNSTIPITISASWSYPYNLKDAHINGLSNETTRTISDSSSIKPSAEFFVFTGVTSMLISLACLVIYVLLDRQYRNNDRYPLVDFIVSVFWTIFWLAGSSAWAKGVSDLVSQTQWTNIAARSNACGPGGCSESNSKFCSSKAFLCSF
jgi:hypothetical protein